MWLILELLNCYDFCLVLIRLSTDTISFLLTMSYNSDDPSVFKNCSLILGRLNCPEALLSFISLAPFEIEMSGLFSIGLSGRYC